MILLNVMNDFFNLIAGVDSEKLETRQHLYLRARQATTLIW